MTNLSEAAGGIDWQVGNELSGPTRYVSHERIIWYGDGLYSAAMGKTGPTRKNAHTDDEYAKEQGLPGAIADGMLSTNWLSSLLLKHFGEPYLFNGYLRTKFIKPTFVGMRVTPHLKVNAINESVDGQTVCMDIWTEDADGTLLVVGEARVTI